MGYHLLALRNSNSNQKVLTFIPSQIPPDIKSQSKWVPLTVLSLSVWALLPPTPRPRPPRVPSTSTSSLETTGSSFSHIQKISHQCAPLSLELSQNWNPSSPREVSS